MNGNIRRMFIVLLSFISNIMIGVIYMYPNYSTLLGVSTPQIVIIGVSSHLGIGIVQFPLAFLHRSKWLSDKGLVFADRIIIIVTLMCLTIGIMGVYLYSEYGNIASGSTADFVIYAILFTIFGMGTGGSFGHGMWVNNYNWSSSPYKKTIISFLSLAAGLGAFLATLVYPYTFQGLSLQRIFMIQWVIYMAIGSVRFIYMNRLTSPKNFSSLRVSLLNDDTKKKAASIEMNEKYDENDADENDNDEVDNYRFIHIFKSYTAWLVFWSSFFGIGIGGTFISMTADVVYSVKSRYDNHLISLVSMAFLASQTLSRLLSALLVKYSAFLLLLQFHIVELIICVIFANYKLDITGCFIVSIGIGWTFGGIWAMFPPIVASQYPGGITHFGKNFGFTNYAPSCGNFIVGIIQTLAYKAQHGNQCQPAPDNDCYHEVFVAFSALSGFATLLVILLGYIIKFKPIGY